MTIEQMVEKARAELILFRGIDNPTKEQIVLYMVFGEVTK